MNIGRRCRGACVAICFAIAGCGARSAVDIASRSSPDAARDDAALRDVGPDSRVELDASSDARLAPPDGCSSHSVVPLPAWAIPSTSMRVVADIRWDAPEARLPPRVTMTLGALRRSDATIVATAQSVVNVDQPITSAGEVYLAAVDSLSCTIDCVLEVRYRDPERSCGRALEMAFVLHELVAVDLDCDGQGDVLEGEVAVTAIGATAIGTSTRTWLGRSTWTVTRDVEPPRLWAYLDEPYDRDWSTLHVVPSEPIVLERELVVDASDRARLIGPALVPERFFLGAEYEHPVAMLPRGGSAGLNASIADLAGNPGDGSALAVTPPDVIFPDDGFDSGTGVELGTGASLYEGTAVIPPIGGVRSALLAPPVDALEPRTRWLSLRTSLDASADAIVVDLRALGSNGAPFPLDTVEVIVMADVGRAVSTGSGELAMLPSADATYAFASDVHSLRAPVPALARPGDRLEVVITYLPAPCGAPALSTAALLVDGVRQESR